MRPDIRIARHGSDQLGESPVWDERAGELLHVDIARGLVHAWSPETGTARFEAHDGEVGAVVLRTCGEGLVVAVERELRLAAGGTTRTLAAVELELAGTRFNDCRCDPQGRLWAGTMSRTRAHGVAALYRLDPGEEITRVLPGRTISNGIGWSPAGDSMHYIDSTTQRIVTFDFDGSDGTICDPRVLAAIDPSDGLPDGLAVDRDGGVWVCLFGGGALRRYDSEGRLDHQLDLPVTNPTCPAFGGPDLATLYVTSARHRLTPAQLAAEPAAGALLALEPGIEGLPAGRFAG